MEDDLKNKEDLHIAGRHTALDIFRFEVFFMYLILLHHLSFFDACCMVHDDDEWYMIHDELLGMDAELSLPKNVVVSAHMRMQDDAYFSSITSKSISALYSW